MMIASWICKRLTNVSKVNIKLYGSLNNAMISERSMI
jgi:hypothetical protein